MRRAALLLPIVLAGCAYQQAHFGLRVSDLTDGKTVAVGAGVHRVEVYEDEATASLLADQVQYRYSGVLEAANGPGSFRVNGPGTGSVEVTFMAGGMQRMVATLNAIAPEAVGEPAHPAPSAPQSVPTPAPTLSPPPEAAHAPTPVAPAPHLDPEARVLESYRQKDKGDYLAAVGLLVDITDPDWLPKAQYLIGEWGDQAVDQGLERAKNEFSQGNRAIAIQILDLVAKLPRRPAQRQAERTLRQQLGGQP